MTPGESALLSRLIDKYRRLLELRRTLPVDCRMEPSAGSKPPAEAPPGTAPLRQRGFTAKMAASYPPLRELVASFPGALRELDSLSTEVLEARLATVEGASERGALEPWMRWMDGYHRLMRAALTVKGGGNPQNVGETIADLGFSVDEFVARVKSPPQGRLNVLVFALLADRYGQAANIIWDTLFPRRGTMPRGYRE